MQHGDDFLNISVFLLFQLIWALFLLGPSCLKIFRFWTICSIKHLYLSVKSILKSMLMQSSKPISKGSSSPNKVKKEEKKVESLSKKIESNPGGGGTILQSPTWDEEGWRNVCQKLDDIDEKVIRMTVNQVCS